MQIRKSDEPRRKRRALHTLSDIVADYVDRFQGCAERELRWFAIQPSLEAAVQVAALAKAPSGKRLNHQRRIPKSVLRESERRLLNALPALQQAATFEVLYQIVSSEIDEIRGIGRLTTYDTALRIGAKLGLEPNVVFLHSGTRVGAKRLGLDASRDFIPVEEFPRALRTLRPREIEDVLCIYKNSLGRESQQISPSTRRCD